MRMGDDGALSLSHWFGDGRDDGWRGRFSGGRGGGASLAAGPQSGGAGQTAFGNVDLGAAWDSVVEVDHVLRRHADAPETGRAADGGFLRGAMDVDVAGEGARVAVFLPRQSQDAGHNRIPSRSIGWKNLARRLPVFEDRPHRRMRPDLLRDF